MAIARKSHRSNHSKNLNSKSQDFEQHWQLSILHCRSNSCTALNSTFEVMAETVIGQTRHQLYQNISQIQTFQIIEVWYHAV